MALRPVFCTALPFLISFIHVGATQKSLFEKYDAKSIGHHDVIKAGVETGAFEECPVDNAFSTSGVNVTFNLVCGRKSKGPVIGACRWRLPSETADGYATFEEKRPIGLNASTRRNGTVRCGCEIDYDLSSDVDFSCVGLNIGGPHENIIILATGPTKLTVDVGSPVDFWIEYLLSEMEQNDSSIESKDGHTLFIMHWYNSVFAKGSWHLVHSYRDPTDAPSRSPRQWGTDELRSEKRVYRAYMRIDTATVDETGLYAFEINYNGLAATSAFYLNVRTESTRLNFFVRKPPNGEIDYDPFEKVNPRFLEAGSAYEIVCAATIGDYDHGDNRSLLLNLYRTPCVKDQFGNTVCNSDTNLELPLIELNEDTLQRLDPVNGRVYSYKAVGRHLVITYSVVAIEPGIYDCAVTSADNQAVRDTADPIRFIPTDIPNAIEKRGAEVTVSSGPRNHSADQSTFYENDRITFECRYQSLDYRFLRWQFVGDRGHAQTIIHTTKRYTLEQVNSSSPYSAAVTRLILPKADAGRDSGKYTCSLSDMQRRGKEVNVQKFVSIIHPVAPRFEEAGVPPVLVVDVNETDSLTLSCLVKSDAAPPPEIAWFKDGQPLSGLFTYTSGMQVVQFRRAVEEDSGNYSCEIKNRAGTIRRDFLVNAFGKRLRGQDRSVRSLIAVLCVLLAFVVILTAVLASMAVKSYRRKKRLAELHQQLVSSTKDNVAPLNPNLPVNQQPENLPYDAQYEIRKERLVLGVILGEGQFGKVLDGYVFSEDGERSLHVAVKVPKDGMDIQQQKMLLSEFKIMAYVGNSVNVLGLVAAVTHRMPKGELYVASEYCERGSLRTYLIQRRSSFHNELDTSSEKNGYILSNEFIRRSRSNAGLSSTLTAGLHAEDSNPSMATSEKQPLRTSDLLSFAYQVANGMDYLASKNVVHRDLALRNILLTKDNLIKIGDFGLALQRWGDARNSAEVKTNDAPLPVKWMALESILYGEYSVQSDVWSFGIALWEIFSLAETPYPDKAPSAALGEWLLAGNRLPPPKYAPEEIYHLMTKCWREQPRERPSFVECRDEIGIDLHLRSQEAFESLQNLLNGYHAYINVQGSVMSDETSPSARLLPASKPVFDRFTVDTESRPLMATAAENLEYNLSTPADTVVAVENLDYASDHGLKPVAWV